MSEVEEFPVHLRTIIDDEIKIISLCERIKEVHKNASYWLPVKQIDRFLFYVRLNKIGIISKKEQLVSLISSKIMFEVM